MQEQDQVTFENDDPFNRKPIAEKMIDLLLSDADVSPMLIDGKWGTGKTTFCEKSIILLKNRIQEAKESRKPIKCSYIDAFAADHANQPLITVIAAISKLIDKSHLKPKFISMAKGVARFSFKTALKAGTAWVLKTNTEELGQEFTDALKNSSNESIDCTINSLIKEHEEAESNVLKLKQVLCEIAQTQELIIFIDELDRCRPDFAVSLIECIKHIFDVPGIQFVLLANLEQIEAAIKHRYGTGVDAKRYLDKFLKFSFTLPREIQNKNYSFASIEHAKNLIRKSEVFKNVPILSLLNNDELLYKLIVHNSLSLREVETFIRYLEIHYTLSSDQALAQPPIFRSLYVLAVFIFVLKKELFHKILNKNVSANDLTVLFDNTAYRSEIDTSKPGPPQVIAALIHLALSDKIEKISHEELNYWKKHFYPHSFQDKTTITSDLYDFFIGEFRKLGLQL